MPERKIETTPRLKPRAAKAAKTKPAFYTCPKCGFLHSVELRVEACKKDRSLFDVAVLNDRFGTDGWVDASEEVRKQS